jgi:DNA gyrase inhibitor GyrI
MSKNFAIVKDETETFTRSTCNCQFCVSTHAFVNEWSGFVPKTKLQKGMKDVVEKIETRLVTPTRTSPRLTSMAPPVK